MQLGSDQEIKEQELKVYAAAQAHAVSKLRLRALKGEPLLQSGDSISVMDLEGALHDLQNEFGARNLRMM
jgi:hypothetical protein